ncbi:type I toxin-antitoxin system SymE family toxin [Salmonella enterica]|nr:type I toxin-antitoxin system SymE family toxin [Salmonella enterica]EDX5692674.1 type I toxin-antitoxin system SymE family toxin [Salmonella enterica subsp. arizonae]EDX9626785.1 type I toxin-antitoxin system SymE family toxin [Salmonella enterica]EFT8085217.1 type I toxin-antitoxin system SymE family toxin [Salmonella enterica]EFT8117885.1 type I toxin-antitoxin system SymE family toxin [Salmonella enterica]
MAEQDSTPEVTLSKTQRRYKVGYVSARHVNSKTCMTTYYSQHPSLHLKGDWLKEAGFDTGRGVTVKISQGCIVLMADCNEVQELREQLYQVRQVVREIKETVV